MKSRSSRPFLNSPQLRSFNVALTFASKPLLLAVACSLAAVSLSSIASATDYTWDANGAGALITDGIGNWNTTAGNDVWNNAGSNFVWPNLFTDKAIFGNGGTIANAAAGTVTVGTVNVGTISFAPTVTTGYTLATGTITLGTGITTTSALAQTISAAITGTNGLAFDGVLNSQVGVTLSGANDYTGITSTSTGGRLTASNATALGSSVGATASTLGTNYTQINALSTVVVTASTAEAFLINGQGSIASGNAPGALRINNTLTLSSLVQLGSNAQISSNFGTATLTGNLDVGTFTLSLGNGNNTIILNANGLVTGSGIIDVGANGGSNVINLNNNSNTFSGTVRVNASSGTSAIGLGGDTVLGTTGTLVFAGGGVQSTNTNARTNGSTIGTFTGNATFGSVPGQNFTTRTGALTFTSTTSSSLGTAVRTFTTNVNTSLSNPFSNTGGITKAGAATLTLGAASTYSGATLVNAGTLLATNTTGSATGTGAVTLTNLVGSAVSGQTVTGSSASYQITGTALTSLGLQLGQTITGTGIPTNTVIAAISATQITLSRPLTAAASTFSTTAYNSSPVLQLGNNDATGSLAPASSISVNSGATFRINRSDAATQGTHFSTAAITGAGRIEQAGSGTTTLNAANSYTGTTTVSAGKLFINGTQSSATGAVSVASNATLGGNGTVGGATTFTGTSIHSAGSAAATVGTQNFSSTLTYGTGTIFDWDLDTLAGGDVNDPGMGKSDAETGTYDQVAAAGAITGGSAIFKVLLATGDSFADAFWNTDKSWTNIFSGGSGSATNLAALFSGFDASGGVSATGLVAGEGQFTLSSKANTLSWSAVPEPTSALAGLLLGAGLLRRRRSA